METENIIVAYEEDKTKYIIGVFLVGDFKMLYRFTVKLKHN